MKKFVLASAIALATAVPASAEFGLGEFATNSPAVGLATGYTSLKPSSFLGIEATYAPVNYLRFSAEAQYLYKDAFLVNVNGHVPFYFGLEGFQVYPIAGVNLGWIKEVYPNYSETNNTIGINVGAGAEYNLVGNLSTMTEITETFGKYTGTQFLIGLRYRF